MNLILLTEADNFLRDDIVLLDGTRAEHILNTIGIHIEDELTVGLLNGLLGTGTVVAFTNSTVSLQLRLNRSPPSPLPLRLILALPRPKVLRRTVAACSALGIKELIFLNSYRVEKSYWGSPLLKPEQLDRHLKLGLEQAKDTVLPSIRLVKRFKPFVEDELPLLLKNTTPLVAHPYSSKPCPKAASGHITLAVGPEGGFIPYEIDKLNEIGFKGITLGARILKVEAVIPLLIGKLF